MIPFEWFQEAQSRIKQQIHTTPLTYDSLNKIFLKWENHQVTGSFKARGALNKIFSLQTWEQERGLVTASAGNHGQGVALAAKLVGCAVKVFASEHANPSKVSAMRQFGAEVILIPGGYGEAEAAGLAYAKDTSAVWISPYNDGQIIAGQGTLTLEIIDQNPKLKDATWVVPIGGGGLISGIGAVLASIAPQSKLLGVQSNASPFFNSIFHYGTQDKVIEYPSLADGLAGPVEAGSITIPLVQKTVDDIVLVSEDEIVQAIAYAWRVYGERIEGSAAVTLAAVLTRKIEARPLVLIVSGGNIELEAHQQIITSY
jgi:threonine dehydratase